MTLWNIIRDFFVQYIFGGYDSNDTFYENFNIGYLGSSKTFDYYDGNTSYTYIPINALNYNSDLVLDYMSLGDWLSTTATIIVLIGICFALWHFVRWLFRLTAGLIRG